MRAARFTVPSADVIPAAASKADASLVLQAAKAMMPPPAHRVRGAAAAAFLARVARLAFAPIKDAAVLLLAVACATLLLVAASLCNRPQSH